MLSDDERDPERFKRDFARYVVSPDLLRELDVSTGSGGRGRGFSADRQPVRSARMIIELDPDYPGGLLAARIAVLEALGRMTLGDRVPDGARGGKYYVFADLTGHEIRTLIELPHREGIAPIVKVWKDEPLEAFLDRSIRTVKADACLTSYGADGRGIVVAIADSGIDRGHPHFVEHANLDLPAGIAHRDFTGGNAPLEDRYGHGTHVAGIVAGRTDGAHTPMMRISAVRDERDTVRTTVSEMPADTILRGVAPKTRLMSLKVLNDTGKGYSSSLIEALEHVAEINDYGRRIRIHCVNLSLGYPFDAEWYAAGHSPLCTVVNRLSRSGVVMVAAAGNDGSVMLQTEGRSNRQRIGVDQSINDPGNADEAITVGATHAEAPHRYGVSFFSSRGPTADGRVKPDLVAPGERILSCAAPQKVGVELKGAGADLVQGAAYFREESGTSMAAPHVSGAVAALLSIRSEFIGRPEAVKAILVGSCTDLKRKSDFQGAGLLDLMRAVQSI